MRDVKYDTTEKAKCLGKWKESSKSKTESCSSWDKWGVLK